MPVFPGDRYFVPSDIPFPTRPAGLLPEWVTLLLTDPPQDDRVTGHTLQDSVPVSSFPSPGASFTSVIGMWGIVDMGAPGYLLKGHRFTYRITVAETSPVYYPGGGPSTRTFTWYLFTSATVAPSTVLNFLQNPGPVASDNEFHTVVQDHPGLTCDRYLWIYLESKMRWQGVQSGTFTNTLYFSDWGASSDPYEVDPCPDPDPPPLMVVRTTSETGDEVELMWGPVAGTNGPVQYTLSEALLGIVYQGNGLGTVLSGLTPGDSYAFTLHATDNCGDSEETDSVPAMPTSDDACPCTEYEYAADPVTSFEISADPTTTYTTATDPTTDYEVSCE